MRVTYTSTLDAIMDVECKAQGAVVHENHVAQGTVCDDSQVLDQAVLGFHAVLPVQACHEYFVGRVDVVKDRVRVRLVAGRKGNELERL